MKPQKDQKEPAAPSEFYEERNRAIYHTYIYVARKHHETVTLAKLVEEVRVSPQPRFWVPSRTVYNIIRRHLRALRQNASRFSREVSPSQLTLDVIAAYNRIHGRRELKGKSLSFIADFVTAEPTKGFYLSHRRLLDIIRRRRKQNFKARCSQALSGLQSFERHTLLYGQKP